MKQTEFNWEIEALENSEDLAVPTIASAGRPGLRPFAEARALLERIRDSERKPRPAPPPSRTYVPPGGNPALFRRA